MNRRGRGIAGVAFALCLLALCQSAAVGANRPDGQAVQFRINPSFSLGSFDGALFGYQRFTGENRAWRLSVGVDLLYETGELEQDYIESDFYGQVFETSDWNHSISILSEWLWYRGDEVSFYYGGGPRLTYSNYQDEWYTLYDEWQRVTRNKGHQISAGLQGSAGVQWAVKDWLALHAEYNVRCVYTHGVSDYERLETSGSEVEYRTEHETTGRVLLDSTGVRFGLSAYF